jgi:hypothetical protein
LDTIYRQVNQEDVDDDGDGDESVEKKEGNKINEYLTYNWFVIILVFW